METTMLKRCAYLPGKDCNRGEELCPGDTYQCPYAVKRPGEAYPQIHISDVRTFVRCRPQWDFSSPHRHGLAPKKPNKHLWLGSAVHYAEQAYYGAGPKRDAANALEAYKAWCKRSFVQIRQDIDMIPDYIKDYARLGAAMLQHYAVWAPVHDDFEVIMPEVPLLVPMDGFDYVGQVDALIRMPDGGVYILETKTASRSPIYTEWDLSWQSTAYFWAARNSPDLKAFNVKGILYNVLLKKAPKEVPLVSGGTRLSKDKRSAVTPELYLKYVEKYDFDPQDYMDILAKLDTSRFFMRFVVAPTRRRLALFESLLNDLSKQMLGDPLIYPPEPPYQACHTCDFWSLCSLRWHGEPWEELAAEDYKEGYSYSPIPDID